VVVTDEVEEPVGEIAVQLRSDRPLLRACPAEGGVEGDYHVAEERPKTRRIR
jgi:hypothetical protein